MQTIESCVLSEFVRVSVGPAYRNLMAERIVTSRNTALRITSSLILEASGLVFYQPVVTIRATCFFPMVVTRNPSRLPSHRQ